MFNPTTEVSFSISIPEHLATEWGYVKDVPDESGASLTMGTPARNTPHTTQGTVTSAFDAYYSGATGTKGSGNTRRRGGRHKRARYT